MKLRFKHQKFQEDATNAVCDVFSGQPNESRKFLLGQGQDKPGQSQMLINQTGWANSEIHLREDDILKNLRGVQKEYKLVPNNRL